jgi:hypothetical protein
MVVNDVESLRRIISKMAEVEGNQAEDTNKQKVCV